MNFKDIFGYVGHELKKNKILERIQAFIFNDVCYTLRGK